uniref:Uncharacterized protein n=1 Tax=Cacopsylla melanoneura TaxID=428564 RepID=A0A8D9BWR0_9HEMI
MSANNFFGRPRPSAYGLMASGILTVPSSHCLFWLSKRSCLRLAFPYRVSMSDFRRLISLLNEGKSSSENGPRFSKNASIRLSFSSILLPPASTAYWKRCLLVKSRHPDASRN